MIGAIIVLVIFIILFYFAYRAAHKCGQGSGGILCKLWHWIA
jgi:hypothetical protein